MGGTVVDSDRTCHAKMLFHAVVNTVEILE